MNPAEVLLAESRKLCLAMERVEVDEVEELWGDHVLRNFSSINQHFRQISARNSQSTFTLSMLFPSSTILHLSLTLNDSSRCISASSISSIPNFSKPLHRWCGFLIKTPVKRERWWNGTSRLFVTKETSPPLDWSEMRRTNLLNPQVASADKVWKWFVFFLRFSGAQSEWV